MTPVRDGVAALPVHRPPPPPATTTFRLDANELPFPPAAHVLAAAVTALHEAHRYPDDAAVELRGRLAELHGVALSAVTVGAGSLDVLRRALAAVVEPGTSVVVPDPGFVEYGVMTRQLGGVPVPVPLADGRPDLGATMAALNNSTRAVLLSNPHTPTGAVLEPDALAEFLDTVPSTVLVVLDEAYAGFAGGRVDGTRLLDGRLHVLVLRSFSKSDGLAGLRVGYGIGAVRSPGPATSSAGRSRSAAAVLAAGTRPAP